MAALAALPHSFTNTQDAAELAKLDSPSSHLDGSIAHAIDTKTKPPGSLGEIERLAARIARIQGTVAPQMERCSMTLFAGDHGIATAGVSAYPQAVTRQMVLNFLAGGAAANVFARSNSIDLIVVDAGVAGGPFEPHPALLDRRIGDGTANYANTAAMAGDEVALALSVGEELGGQRPAQAAAFGEMGIGNTSSAAMLGHKIAGIDLATLVGPGTGLDEAGVRSKFDILSGASRRTAKRLDGRSALEEYGGFEIAMMAGAMIGAAAAAKLVIVDGFIATAAALAAIDMEPALADYCVYAHRSAEPGHDLLLAELNACPLLDLGLRLGEGTGALLAWPLIRSATNMLNEMASFESAGVSGPA
jgi:nicotinate-nucleotide--dimethylbenzimidazole phosphoribosyltransferase